MGAWGPPGAASGDPVVGCRGSDGPGGRLVEERQHHTRHGVDGEEPHAIVMAERTDAFPAGGTGEIEPDLPQARVIRPPQANVHRAMDDDGCLLYTSDAADE